jgi:signal transduction histidine kinase/CheY-like chemotaxis protein
MVDGSLPLAAVAESLSPSQRPARHFLTLRQRLTVSLMSVGLASLCVSALTYVVVDLFNHRLALAEHCVEQAERIAWRWQDPDNASPKPDAAWLLGFSNDEQVARARFFDPTGTELETYSRPDRDGVAWIERLFAVHAEREVFRAGRPLGSVAIDGSTEALYARARTHGGLFLVLAGVSALITLGLARRIHHRFSDQLLDLAHAANAISTRKDYSIRAVRRSEDEIGILVDTFNHMITQIELREQQLKAEVKRAEAARVAKAQFLATMSHEIRTPINGVLGMTQLLLDTPLSNEQKDYGRTIHRSAEGLLSIINDILDFSKGEAGRYEIETIPFTAARVAGECIETVSIVAAEKHLELCLEVDEQVPAHLLGDPARLRQVLLNLLSNALKFTARGEIVLRLVLEERTTENARVRFEVQDTGIGIPKDRLDRLFQPFSQVDASSSRKYGGTGLGLAISRQIIEAMGGTLFVKTEEGVGSTFGFKLLLALADEQQAEENVPAPRGLRILIADPSPTSSAAIARMLGEDNYLETTGEGTSARMLLLEAANAQRPFDLVLADLRLAEDFVRPGALLGEACTRAPLVVLAQVNQLAAGSTLAWKGNRVALAKPVKRQELLWSIAEVLRGPVPQRRTPAPSPAPPQPLPDRLVLVAEDHPVNQRITTRFLEKLGLRYEVAANGQEALEAFKKKHFDLVLMDVQMPVMDGLEATLAIRKLEGLRGTHVPIVALTANVLEEHRREARRAGFDDYLAKPVKFEELRERVVRWISAEPATK